MNLRTLTALLVFFLALISSAEGQVCSITIDNVTNAQNDTTLLAGNTHQFKFRLISECTVPGEYHNTTNGFVVYSPDGATWGYTLGEFLPAFQSLDWTDAFTLYYHKVNNSGAFTQITSPAPGTDSAAIFFAGYSELVNPTGGFPTGFNDPGWQIEIESDTLDNGLHVCIDSSFTPPGGTWKWISKADNTNTYPEWDGPYCYRIFSECCVGGRGNIRPIGRCDETSQGPDIADLTFLINHLFIDFQPLCCPDEADLAEPLDGAVDIADLTALINHLFLSFEPLPSCD